MNWTVVVKEEGNKGGSGGHGMSKQLIKKKKRTLEHKNMHTIWRETCNVHQQSQTSHER